MPTFSTPSTNQLCICEFTSQQWLMNPRWRVFWLKYFRISFRPHWRKKEEKNIDHSFLRCLCSIELMLLLFLQYNINKYSLVFVTMTFLFHLSSSKLISFTFKILFQLSEILKHECDFTIWEFFSFFLLLYAVHLKNCNKFSHSWLQVIGCKLIDF